MNKEKKVRYIIFEIMHSIYPVGTNVGDGPGEQPIAGPGAGGDLGTIHNGTS